METFLGIMIPFLGTTLGSACVFFMKKNTQAAPSVVPKKGTMIPRKVSICLTAFALQYYLFLLNPASSRYSGCAFRYGSLSPQMV